jgi:hypothetical protein
VDRPVLSPARSEEALLDTVSKLLTAEH